MGKKSFLEKVADAKRAEDSFQYLRAPSDGTPVEYEGIIHKVTFGETRKDDSFFGIAVKITKSPWGEIFVGGTYSILVLEKWDRSEELVKKHLCDIWPKEKGEAPEDIMKELSPEVIESVTGEEQPLAGQKVRIWARTKITKAKGGEFTQITFENIDEVEQESEEDDLGADN